MVDWESPVPARAQLRRRGRGLGLRGVFVERDEELGVVTALERGGWSVLDRLNVDPSPLATAYAAAIAETAALD